MHVTPNAGMGRPRRQSLSAPLGRDFPGNRASTVSGGRLCAHAGSRRRRPHRRTNTARDTFVEYPYWAGTTARYRPRGTFTVTTSAVPLVVTVRTVV